MEEGAAACHDPANELLIWHINGSLKGEEDELVRLHLRTCEICRREMDELSQIGRHLQEHPLSLHGGASSQNDGDTRAPKGASASGAVETPHAASSARWIRSGAGIAAAAALVVVVVLFWYSGRSGSGSGAPPAGNSIVTLDLGAGTPRGGESYPSLRIDGSAREVRFSFVAPVNLDATYGIEIHSPLGEIVARRERAALLLDSQGRGAYSAPADRLTVSGDYDFILREFAPQGEIHEYHYPFRVGRPDSP
ncbi:MAG TPA: hypothetical protein VGR38_12805 [Candidatus Polarisedimenticolia bacterium]|jgi:hypothetical protein|nr:hypothetical protein [Candidatus Polarisedimenticolia bacterium]